MQLYQTEKREKFRLYFNEKESNNMAKALEGDISIRNLELCHFIETVLPQKFKECKGKRVMVMNVYYDMSNISAVVFLQDVAMAFPEPKEKFGFIKITDISFESKNSFDEWMEDKNYLYKVKKNTNNKKYEVIVFNMRTEDELDLSENDGYIEKKCGVIEYIIFLFIQKIRKQDRAYS